MTVRHRVRVLICMVAGLATFAAPAAAQSVSGQTGRLIGRVVDAATGRGLVGVVIRIEGADRGTLSGVDGRYPMSAAIGLLLSG